jgi:hypothetical protein
MLLDPRGRGFHSARALLVVTGEVRNRTPPRLAPFPSLPHTHAALERGGGGIRRRRTTSGDAGCTQQGRRGVARRQGPARAGADRRKRYGAGGLQVGGRALVGGGGGDGDDGDHLLLLQLRVDRAGCKSVRRPAGKAGEIGGRVRVPCRMRASR